MKAGRSINLAASTLSFRSWLESFMNSRNEYAAKPNRKRGPPARFSAATGADQLRGNAARPASPSVACARKERREFSRFMVWKVTPLAMQTQSETARRREEFTNL